MDHRKTFTMTLDELFSQAALRYPDNVAVTYVDGFKQEDLTYRELSTRALQISSSLKTFCKLKNTIVGVYSRIIPDLIACLVGIVRIPAAFAPIGLDWPVKMVKEFLENSDVKVVVVNVELLEKFNQVLELLGGTNRTFRLITECEDIGLNGFVLAIASEGEISSISQDYNQSLAYIMKTSGTTGHPTQVKVPHVCIVANITSLSSKFDMNPDDSVAVVSPYTFDPFIVQLFLALSTGGRAVLVSESIKLQAEKFCQILFDDLKISVFQPTPFFMYLIGQERIKHRVLGKHSTLRVLAFGGEACPSLSTLREWKHPECNTRLFNLYGITEVSSWASCFEITDKELQDKKSIDSNESISVGDEVMSLDVIEDSAPLGNPLDDTILEVRNDDGSKIDEGVGCIFIGGGNRVCYLGNETSFKPGTIRPTGDIGYIKENQIWYIGRKNRNIKRQSKVISLDWLEQTISKAFPNFIFCAVSDAFSTGLQNKIYLFVKPEALYDERLFLTLLKKNIHESFPPYVQPDYIGVVNTLPMTSHGKVDTKVLLRTCQEEEILKMSEPVETTLEKLWLKGFMKLEDDSDWPLSFTTGVGGSGKEEVQVSVTDNTQEFPPRVKREYMFVEHGGSSLAALRVANEIKAWFRQKVGSQADELTELVDVILNNSFGKLCDYIKTRVSGKSYNCKTTIDQKVEKSGTLGSITSQEITESNQDDIHTLAVKDKDSSVLFPQHFDLEKMPLKIVDEKEMAPAVSPKRRKIEVHCKHTLQSDASTNLPNCFCSIQRGMRTSTCPSCVTSSNKVHYQEVPNLWSFKDGISFKWKTNFGKCIDTSPLVVGANNKDQATLYLGSHAHVFKAVCLSSGMVLWETLLGDRIESSAALSKCGHLVIVGCYDGKVYALNRRDGRIIWTFQTGEPVKSSPCVDPSTGLVWIGSHDNFLYALDVCHGDCISSIDCGSTCYSSPWILENLHLVFIGTLGGGLLCVDASTHKIKWSNQCAEPIFSSPLASSHGVIYACVDGTVYCCDFDGNPVWEFKTTGPIFSSQSVFLSSTPKKYTGCTLFGSHDGFVYCVSNSGELRWKFETDSQVYSTPFVTELVDYSHSQLDISGTTLLPKEHENTGLVKSLNEPVVVVCSTRGTLYCLSLDKGMLVSSWSFPGEVFSSPVVVGNFILVGCRDDFFYCLTTNQTQQQHTSTDDEIKSSESN